MKQRHMYLTIYKSLVINYALANEFLAIKATKQHKEIPDFFIKDLEFFMSAILHTDIGFFYYRLLITDEGAKYMQKMIY